MPRLAASVTLLLVCSVRVLAADGDARISAPYAGSQIVVKTTNRLAGAIDSVTWNGKEFIDSADHGRQLQSASNFDAGHGKMIGETFNPTEAGSRRDGAGATSSSKLLCLKAEGNVHETCSLMAFWLRPGERSSGHLARNTTILSNHVLRKRVTIGIPEHPNVVEYVATFTVPEGEGHTFAQFEAVTGYMPPEFSTFLRFDPKERKLVSLDDGPGEQADPVVLSTPDGRYAMGVFSPQQPSKGFEQAGYGRFRFVPQKVVKWNCVFRVRNPDGIPPGDYRYVSYVVVGTRAEVEKTLVRLVEDVGESSDRR